MKQASLISNLLNTILDRLYEAEFGDEERERGERIVSLINNGISRRLGWGICTQSHEAVSRCPECKAAV